MAQRTLATGRAEAPHGENDGIVAEQTKYLLQGFVLRQNGSSGSAANSRAFEEMQGQALLGLFGSEMNTAKMDVLYGRLNSHVQRMQDDQILQSCVQDLGKHLSYDTLYKVACRILKTINWSNILAFLVLGLELCRKFAGEMITYVINAFASVLSKVAAGWITSQGGWIAYAVSGAVATAAQGLWQMRERNLDPEIYPNISSSFYHFPESLMGFTDFLTQSQGYLNVTYRTYEYAPYPTCSKQTPYCNSTYLQCDVHTEMCLPVSVPGTRGDLEQGACHDDKCSSEPSTPSLQPIQSACSPPKNIPCQNNFCIQANCDVNQWVWMQVRIIGQRSPIFQDGRSDPVQDWVSQNQFNMYNHFVNSNAKRHISQGKDNFDRYNSCSIKDGVGKIFMMSFGLNYDCIFKDFSFMDQRQAVSLAMGFVAVKDPGVNETTKVILRAYDNCGRLCRTTCRVPKSDPPRYKACSGIVEVTSEFPRQFGQTYAEAMLNTFVYSSNSDSPDVKFDDVFITFFCDYN